MAPPAMALPDAPDAAVSSTSRPAPDEPHVTLTMERSGCMGSCPAYRAAVRDDGLVTLDGVHYVRQHGRVVRRVAPSIAQSLISEYQQVRTIPRKKSRIVIMTSDMPQITFTLEDVNGTKTTLEHDLGDSFSPDEWAAFEKKIDEQLHTDTLTSCGDEGCPP